MTVYKTGFYSVNGVKMYYDAVANVWSTVAADGTLTPTQLDALANPIAGWTEPSVFPGGSITVAVSFVYQGITPTGSNITLHVAVGHMSGITFITDTSSDTDLLQGFFAGNDGVNPKTYTTNVVLPIPASFNASAPYEYSIYFTLGGQTSPTYDKAFKTLAAGYSSLTITSVVKTP